MVTLDDGLLLDHNLHEAPLRAACCARVPGDVVATVAKPWCSLGAILRHLDTLAENSLMCARREHVAAATDGHTIHGATACGRVGEASRKQRRVHCSAVLLPPWPTFACSRPLLSLLLISQMVLRTCHYELRIRPSTPLPIQPYPWPGGMREAIK